MLFIDILTILFSGGYDWNEFNNSNKILLFDEKTTTFKQTGELEQRRDDHSVSVVDTSDFICS